MLFKKKHNEDDICRFCANSKLTDDDDKVVCSYKGEVDAFSSCKKFSYDLLKRDPGKQKKIEPMEYIDINS